MAYVDLDCYLHNLYFQTLAPTPSQTNVLYVSRAVSAMVREEQPKRKRILVRIGSLLMEACEIIYVFFPPLYKCLMGIFCDFDETTKNYIL